MQNNKSKLKIKEMGDRDQWESFVSSQPHAPFLQSWAWGEFQKTLGNRVYRLGLFEGADLKGVAAGYKMRRKLGTFLYVPHGPILRVSNPAEGNPPGLGFPTRRVEESAGLREILRYLKNLAKKEGCDYLRVEPKWREGEEGRRLMMDGGFRKAVGSVQAKRGWLLDLTPSEEEILMGMRQTTRYLVRQGIKQGLKIIQSERVEDFEMFWKIYSETSQRQKFTPQGKNYLKKQFEILGEAGMARIFFGFHQGKVMSAAMFIFYGDTATYLHSGSYPTKEPVSYLLQWEAIKTAKKEGKKIYDFWGIAETDDPKHPWYGLSLFKKGFGGYEVNYLGAWDYPLTPRYLLVRGVEGVRKILRST